VSGPVVEYTDADDLFDKLRDLVADRIGQEKRRGFFCASLREAKYYQGRDDFAAVIAGLFRDLEIKRAGDR
jgi:hypothetical protein